MKGISTSQIVDFILRFKDIPLEKLYFLGFSGSLFIFFSYILVQWHLQRCENFWQFCSGLKLKGKEWGLLLVNIFLLVFITLAFLS